MIDSLTKTKTSHSCLDVETQEQAKIILDQTGEQLSWIKIGLQTYLRDGPDFIRYLADNGKRIFLDLKLHDIPNTMAKALESPIRLPVELLTLHASAGRKPFRDRPICKRFDAFCHSSWSNRAHLNE